MQWPGPDDRDPRTSESGAIEQTAVQGESLDSPPAEDPSLEELVAQLERDPDECRSAFVGLESLEQETRLSIVRSLRDVPAGPGVVNLLRQLNGSEDEATRESARVVLDELLGMSGLESAGEERAAGELGLACGPSAELMPIRALSGPRPIRCLITAVDGSGRGTIVVSSTLVRERRTAAFLCDLLEGITDAVGSAEDESAEAGGLVDEVEGRPEVDTMEVPPELARAACRVPDAQRAPGREPGGLLARGDARRRLPAPRFSGPRRGIRIRRGARRSLAVSRIVRRLPELARRLTAHLRAGRGDLPEGGSDHGLAGARRGRIPVPLRAPDPPSARAVPEDAPLDGLVLDLCRRARAFRVGADPGERSSPTSNTRSRLTRSPRSSWLAAWRRHRGSAGRGELDAGRTCLTSLKSVKCGWPASATRMTRGVRKDLDASSAEPRDRAGADLPGGQATPAVVPRADPRGIRLLTSCPTWRRAWRQPSPRRAWRRAALAAGLAPFFSSAFFFLAVSRASPMIEHSFGSDWEVSRWK